MTQQQIAELVWDQISTGHAEDFEADWISPPKPFMYHIDEFLVFENGKLTRNTQPFLVNEKGRYRARPGGTGIAPDGKAKIGYDVTPDGFVLAGIYMQTYTRINSMEAACESGRHAVNAVLRSTGFPGEPCAIWDPEDFEPDTLARARELDERLCARGLPHMLDIV
jgi:hypothetical protein